MRAVNNQTLSTGFKRLPSLPVVALKLPNHFAGLATKPKDHPGRKKNGVQ